MLDKVFDPQEDSFLLAETIWAQPSLEGKLCLDIGTGCGIQAIACAKKGGNVLVADMDGKCVENALLNAKLLGLQKKVKAKKSDLFSAIPRNKKFDFIVFNPPYLPSKKPEILALDGGKNGREILDRFLAGLPQRLAMHGIALFMQSSLNGLQRTKKKLRENGLAGKIVARQKLFFEELVVFEAKLENRPPAKLPTRSFTKSDAPESKDSGHIVKSTILQ